MSRIELTPGTLPATHTHKQYKCTFVLREYYVILGVDKLDKMKSLKGESIGMVLQNLWCHIEALQATNTSHSRPYIYLSSLTPDTLLTSLPP